MRIRVFSWFTLLFFLNQRSEASLADQIANQPPVRLLFRDEVYKIVGAGMSVYNALGSGLSEGVYQEALEIESAQRGIPFQAQAQIPIHYKGTILRHCLIPDAIAYGEVIVELKTIPYIGKVEQAQLLNYLRIANKRVGVILNFGHAETLETRRMVR